MVDFTLINFDSNLLASYFNARTVSHTVTAIQNTARPYDRGAAVTTPWDLAARGRVQTLAGKFNAVRGTKNFIDLSAKNVTQTQNKDEKALFALYQALNNLKTIADYSAADSTPTALLPRLNSQFRGGLSQVQDYLQTAPLDKLTLMFGDKKPRVESGIALGKAQRDIIGATLPVSSKTQAIPGLVGNEIFTLKLDKTTAFDNITIDLSKVTGPLDLANVTTYLNQQIIALTDLDANGNPTTRYKSRFTAEQVSTGKFALKLTVNPSEKVTLTAQVADPSLYITGSHKDVGTASVETATLSKIGSLATVTPITEFTKQIAGTDQASFVPPLLDAKGVAIPSKGQVFTTKANASAVDSQGNVYVVGSTQGDFGNQINVAGQQDVFLSKHDASGNLLWSRLLGASGTAKAFDITIDSTDNVFIAGQVNSTLAGPNVFSGFDSFVSKFNSGGQELWTHQQDTVGSDQANSLAIDGAGNVIVTGTIAGRLNATTTAGGASDVFVTKLSSLSGSLVASAQIGGAGTELGEAVAIAGDGNILVAARESGRVILHKLDITNPTIQLATYDLGNLGGGAISDITVDAAGAIYVTGSSLNGALTGGTVTNAHSGGLDGFVTKLSDTGTAINATWTHFLGSTGTDSISGISVQNGAVFLTGKTNGTLPGATKTGATDGFAAKINSTTGTADWIRQFGGVSGYNNSSSLAFSATGSSVLTKLGLPTGLYDNSQTLNIETQTSARVGDHFFVSVNGGKAQKVTISAGEDYTSLAKKVQRLSYRFIKAVPIAGLKGPELKIETINGSTLDIIAGKSGQDALAKLGLPPGKILPIKKIFAIGVDTLGTDPNNLGGIFALKLLSGYSLRSKKEAQYVSTQVNIALETVKRAFRSLTYDPAKAELLKQAKLKSGPAPAYLLSRLANYKDGLSRLSAFSGSSGGLSI